VKKLHRYDESFPTTKVKNSMEYRLKFLHDFPDYFVAGLNVCRLLKKAEECIDLFRTPLLSVSGFHEVVERKRRCSCCCSTDNITFRELHGSSVNHSLFCWIQGLIQIRHKHKSYPDEQNYRKRSW
jgi:hypothetical protein